MNRGFFKKTHMFLVTSILLLSVTSASALQFVPSQDVEFVNDDTITVYETFTAEGEGITYIFNYDLEEGTVISWNLESAHPDTLFDFLIYYDLEDPFSSSIVEVFDENSSIGQTTVTHTGMWFMHVRHSRFHGNYTLNVFGTIEQSGTPVPDTSSTVSSNTGPTSSSPTGTPPPMDLDWTVIGIALLVLFTITVTIWKRRADTIPSIRLPSGIHDLSKQQWTVVFAALEKQLETTEKTTSETLRECLFQLNEQEGLQLPYARIPELVTVLIEAEILVEYDDITYGLSDQYSIRKEKFISSL